MPLYLSSLAIPNQKAFLDLFPRSGIRHIAIIPTAWNKTPSSISEPFIQKVAAQLTDMELTRELVDIQAYVGKTAELEQKLEECGGVWVTGGNTFYLNYFMRESGFDTLLPGLLAKGFVYGGESAGAVVAGKTLHGIELLDNPDDAPSVLWEGLGLVDYGVIPHWGRPKYAGRIEQSFEEMRLFCAVKTLEDGNLITMR